MSIVTRRPPDNGPARKGKNQGWSGDDFLHMLDNSLAHLAMTTSMMLDSDLPRRRSIHHLQVMQLHVQLMALVAQAWVTIGRSGAMQPRPGESCDLNETLILALRAYDKERMGISVRVSPQLPAVPGDRRQWQFVLRALLHTAAMQRQGCEVEVVAGKGHGPVSLKFRRTGEPEGDLSASTLKLLVESCRYIIEGHGGKLVVRDSRRYGWRAQVEIPRAEPEDN